MRIKEKLQPILFLVSWARFARTYFGKSPSWIYHKIDGIDEITEKELLDFKEHLITLSNTIRECAEQL